MLVTPPDMFVLRVYDRPDEQQNTVNDLHVSHHKFFLSL